MNPNGRTEQTTSQDLLVRVADTVKAATGKEWKESMKHNSKARGWIDLSKHGHIFAGTDYLCCGEKPGQESSISKRGAPDILLISL